METLLKLLRKAMQNARILAVVEFDPALFLFTAALEGAIKKGEEYIRNKKKTASVQESYTVECRALLIRYSSYLSKRRVENGYKNIG